MVVQIMSGPYSTTPQYTFTLPGENPYFPGRLDIPQFHAADVNGDGVFDFMISYYRSYAAFTYACKVIDLVSGSALLTLDDVTYNYGDGYFSDLDGDGKLEFIVPRWLVNAMAHCYLVYATNAPATSVHDISSEPLEFKLSQNYPNPFNLTTKIEYTLEKRARMTLTIYDAIGREVRHYDQGLQEGGHHTLIWDGRDKNGNTTATGTYFYVLTVEGRMEPKKMILLK
jgi:hypothetical protein